MQSLQNFLDKLDVYREIFTEVRLIDLSQIIQTCENIYISCACRDIDGICRTCKNCIAVKAISDNSTKIKWEYINSEIHQITVSPTVRIASSIIAFMMMTADLTSYFYKWFVTVHL